MKISKLPEWISENADNIMGFFVVCALAAGLIALICSSGSDAEKKFPVGTDVVVKNTNIKGTVTHCFSEMVTISYVEKDGTVKKVEYNYNLVEKQ